ncbi:toll/interleukin-1 receptor domain-containing protein [Labedaea rhizosphaerae]|uniref:TIR domain-containing protein n=1 Tax=Labedaea rhizosphaerae TaxID=598644 RepID=A0A4R6SBN2_LABRH|nr:toll/interleukin-1 receptor domain-containing protein [Labedaea rhizosphaerae]TDP97350.1 TIR domain-containing protein [Labedaea rhizosphaerae]
MPEIFINYRTGDGHHLATILDQKLRARFGDEHVFLDHNAIPAGAEFAEVLDKGVWSSTVLLCVIGPDWLTDSDDNGKPKIFDGNDWIHRELVLAFQHGVHVIPVIDERAAQPLRAEDLPAPLARLALLQYRTYRAREVDASIDRIVADLLALIPGLVDREAPDETTDTGQAISVENSGTIGANFFGPVHNNGGGTVAGMVTRGDRQ